MAMWVFSAQKHPTAIAGGDTIGKAQLNQYIPKPSAIIHTSNSLLVQFPLLILF